METAQAFSSLVSAGKFQEASHYLTDEFMWTGPLGRLDKTGWLKTLQKRKPDKPNFGPFQLGDNNLKVSRRLSKRMMSMNINLVQTLEMTEDGKIRNISVTRV